MMKGLRGLPRTVWALGFVSLFMDLSSEMIHSLLPVFLVGTLGATPALVGLIEGVGEATASITKVFSGWLSDRLGHRKLLAVLGYGLGALSKPIFPLAASPLAVLGARVSDRVGKGLRGAPRDALVADVTSEAVRGAAYGLRQALDTVGAFLGPLVAIGLMWLLAGDIRTIFALAVIPAVVSVLLLVLGVEEPKGGTRALSRPPPIRWAQVKAIRGEFWLVVLVGVLFTMARFSEAFLVLRGTGVGLPISWAPLVLIVMNLVYSAASAPFGSLSDTVGRRPVLAIGLGALVVSDVVLAFAHNVTGVLIGVALWGLHMGMSQGLLAAMVASAAPASLRGTAFGLFNLITGVTMILASGVAGLVWSRFEPEATFVLGGMFAALSLIVLAALPRRFTEART